MYYYYHHFTTSTTTTTTITTTTTTTTTTITTTTTTAVFLEFKCMPLYSVTVQFHGKHLSNNRGQLYYNAKIFIIPRCLSKTVMYASGTTEGLYAGTTARARICQNSMPACNTHSTIILNLHT